MLLVTSSCQAVVHVALFVRGHVVGSIDYVGPVVVVVVPVPFVLSAVLDEVPSFVLFVVVGSVVVYVDISIGLLCIEFVLSLPLSSFLILVLTLPLYS